MFIASALYGGFLLQFKTSWVSVPTKKKCTIIIIIIIIIITKSIVSSCVPTRSHALVFVFVFLYLFVFMVVMVSLGICLPFILRSYRVEYIYIHLEDVSFSTDLTLPYLPFAASTANMASSDRGRNCGNTYKVTTQNETGEHPSQGTLSSPPCPLFPLYLTTKFLSTLCISQY